MSSTISVTEIVAEDGKRREMTCLPLKHLNGWLFGVDSNRVDPEVRDRLIEYQRECYDVLADYWQKGSASNPRAAAASNPMIGQATGLPTTQLVALQTQGWKIIDRLKLETVRELRADLYEDLSKVFSDMGKTLPPLSAIGREEPDQPAALDSFWAMFETLQAAGHQLNHSRNPDAIAINLNEVYTVARAAGVRPMKQSQLKKLLPMSKNPRLISTGKTVSSVFKTRDGSEGAIPASVHAWIFEKREGGAA